MFSTDTSVCRRITIEEGGTIIKRCADNKYTKSLVVRERANEGSERDFRSASKNNIFGKSKEALRFLDWI